MNQPDTKPLAGIRVLDLTRALAGPFASMILGDLGADIVKIEPADGGDMTRGWGPFAGGQSIYYLSANRNKRSLAVDFRDPGGLAAIRRIAQGCNVVIENFRPGIAAAMGLDYAELRKSNPALVYASISGYGSDGPARDWPSFDQIAQGQAGLMDLTGSTGPTRLGAPLGDMTAGMWAVIGILAAVRRSEATGKGEHLETSLLASLVAMLGVQGQRYLSTGEVPERSGNTHPVIAPYGTYAAQDALMNIAPATEKMWRTLCVELGVPELATDERFATNEKRVAHRDLVDRLVSDRMRLKTRAQWMEQFIAAGIPAGPINRLDEVYADPQVRHARMVRTVQHPSYGAVPQAVIPLSFRSVDVREPASAPPLLGQDSVALLRDFGFDEEEVRHLLDGGTVVQAEAEAFVPTIT
jgi:crotonobetainyl-CoA:carnitine CoA-transferase CaiB-like acyl-CoA transferase